MRPFSTSSRGAVLGGLLVVWLPYYSAGWSTHLLLFSSSDAVILSNAIYGVVLIVITFTRPGGLATGLDKVAGCLARVVPFRPSTAQRSEMSGTQPDVFPMEVQQ